MSKNEETLFHSLELMRITRKVEHFHFQSDFSTSKINQISPKLILEIEDQLLLLTFKNHFAKTWQALFCENRT